MRDAPMSQREVDDARYVLGRIAAGLEAVNIDLARVREQTLRDIAQTEATLKRLRAGSAA